ncbi:hypothetical protein [Methylobacterium dankookense]|uniref:ASCH domain-containing protein n=1 Tax=Methylobacterium dankookense TaxID=560405 RepID=A0A564G3Z8_9HYPH|nr:hypothetical protein [Methylobacterium dankookense]GJD55206.1 hypothetical protein IFDJLNFL_1090 [Methylobacterium dankookense]VUF15215.1 hypothetical protein MTDSW087_04950 [Methylobacterium dankookense]
MVAYSFKRQFMQPIRERVKPHTLRDFRRGRSRHARPGEQLQLYVGMRTSSCELIGRAVCDRFQSVSLDFSAPNPIVLTDLVEVGFSTFEAAGEPQAVRAVDSFAVSDGFEDIEAMARFWRDTHDTSIWQGCLIGWDVTTLVLADAAVAA